MELYDMAKQIVSTESPMEPIEVMKKLAEMVEDIMSNSYSMLLCNERRDFTIFHSENCTKEAYMKDLTETITNRGNLLFADRQPDGAWEIWIRDRASADNFAYYLFDYSDAVVEVGNE